MALVKFFAVIRICVIAVGFAYTKCCWIYWSGICRFSYAVSRFVVLLFSIIRFGVVLTSGLRLSVIWNTLEENTSILMNIFTRIPEHFVIPRQRAFLLSFAFAHIKACNIATKLLLINFLIDKFVSPFKTIPNSWTI